MRSPRLRKLKYWSKYIATLPRAEKARDTLKCILRNKRFNRRMLINSILDTILQKIVVLATAMHMYTQCLAVIVCYWTRRVTGRRMRTT